MKVRTEVSPQYKVLAINMLSDEVKEQVEATIKTLATGYQAAIFATKNEGWSYHPGIAWFQNKFGALQYKGVDVAIFFHRQFLKIRPEQDGPVDAMPGKIIRSEDEAWIRVSLLDSKSALKQSQFYTQEFEKMRTENSELQRLVASSRRENDQLNALNLKLELQMQEMKKNDKKS